MKSSLKCLLSLWNDIFIYLSLSKILMISCKYQYMRCMKSLACSRNILDYCQRIINNCIFSQHWQHCAIARWSVNTLGWDSHQARSSQDDQPKLRSSTVAYSWESCASSKYSDFMFVLLSRISWYSWEVWSFWYTEKYSLITLESMEEI